MGYRFYIGDNCRIQLVDWGEYFGYSWQDFVLRADMNYPAEFDSKGEALDFLATEKPHLLKLVIGHERSE